MTRREENQKIFQDTERLCKTNSRLKDSVARATVNQKMIPETLRLPTPDKKRFPEEARILISKKRSFEAAEPYARSGSKVAVHNFASASNPGGGVVNGSGAQEECLCRCSGLYFSLNVPEMWNSFYAPHRAEHNPLHNDDIIYTQGVTVFKTDTDHPELMPEEDWYDVDVITCAAPNLRQKPSNTYNSGDGQKPVRISDRDLQALHEKRLRRILDVAVMEGVDCIILGAFGCGAFMNSPRCVATAAARVVPEYLFAFRNIEFAVYCRPDDDTNYRVFRSMLGRFVKNGPQT